MHIQVDFIYTRTHKIYKHNKYEIYTFFYARDFAVKTHVQSTFINIITY